MTLQDQFGQVNTNEILKHFCTARRLLREVQAVLPPDLVAAFPLLAMQPPPAAAQLLDCLCNTPVSSNTSTAVPLNDCRGPVLVQFPSDYNVGEWVEDALGYRVRIRLRRDDTDRTVLEIADLDLLDRLVGLFSNSTTGTVVQLRPMQFAVYARKVERCVRFALPKSASTGSSVSLPTDMPRDRVALIKYLAKRRRHNVR
jgi:hypothetical protein